MSPIGFVVGASEPSTFQFVTSVEAAPPHLEYVCVEFETERGPQTVLAQIVRLVIDSPILTPDLGLPEAETLIRESFLPPHQVIGTARVLGYHDGRRVLVPRRAVSPATPVYRAPSELLSRFFGQATGAPIGTLLNRDDVPVAIDINGFRRHLAILAQTGGGKSYLTGLLIEALAERFATVLVFDPNSDYVQLRKVAADADRPYPSARKTPFADRVTVYRLPEIQNRRYPDDLVGPTRPFTVRFSQLDPSEVANIAGVPESARRIRGAIESTCDDLSDRNIDYGPRELHDALASQQDPASRNALVYVAGLQEFGVWGYSDVSPDDLLAPGRISILDLAGADRAAAAYAADRALREIWSRAVTGQLPSPVFIVLEEAHHLVPADRENRARSHRIITTIAAEGRKFQVFLVLVTQRPSKVHQDALSQCGSQIILRMTNPDDQTAVRRAAEAISDDLLQNLPGLNPGEAVVLGPLVQTPVLVSIHGRQSAEGGADIDVAAALERARDASEIEARRIQPTIREFDPDPLF